MTSEQLIEEIEYMMSKRKGVKPIGKLKEIYDQIKLKYSQKKQRIEPPTTPLPEPRVYNDVTPGIVGDLKSNVYHPDVVYIPYSAKNGESNAP